MYFGIKVNSIMHRKLLPSVFNPGMQTLQKFCVEFGARFSCISKRFFVYSVENNF